MRDLAPELQAHLDSGATTLCHCWRVTRRDGSALSFTDHDRPLVFQERAHDPATALEAGARESSTGLNIDNSRVVGALTAAAITEEDIALGRYDAAEFELWLVNWADTSQYATLFAGALGEAARGPLGFEVELRGLAHALNQPVGRAFATTCDAAFGDGRCKADAAAHTASATVTAIDGARLTVTGLGDDEDGWFDHGVVTLADGQTRRVKAHAVSGGATVLALWRKFDVPPAVGAGVQIIAGCDRTFVACKDKFANAASFRGFPHIPGNDWAVQWPSSAQDNSGGSLFE